MNVEGRGKKRKKKLLTYEGRKKRGVTVLIPNEEKNKGI